MKILRLYLTLPPIVGGMENHIYQLSKWQIVHGHIVKLCFNRGNALSSNDIKILGKINLARIRPQCIGVIIFYLFVLFHFILNKNKFDVIHAHGDWSSMVFLFILKRIVHAQKIVFSIHDELKRNRIRRKLISILIENVNLIFSTGYNNMFLLSSLTQVPSIFQPSGIENIFFQSKSLKKRENSEIFRVITVANLFKKKNVIFILLIAQQLPQVVFTIIGDGPERKRIHEAIIDRNITNVLCVGKKSRAEIFHYLLQSHCFLLTSTMEGTPTAILEAMATGLPVVTSNAGGVAHIIKDGVNGYVLNDFECNSYCQKIRLLMNNEELRYEIAKNNRCAAKNYSWDVVAKNITNRIEEMYR
jgi:L-malate glycosyltransferase